MHQAQVVRPAKTIVSMIWGSHSTLLTSFAIFCHGYSYHHAALESRTANLGPYTTTSCL